jgi:hypothetical protein
MSVIGKSLHVKEQTIFVFSLSTSAQHNGAARGRNAIEATQLDFMSAKLTETNGKFEAHDERYFQRIDMSL